MCVCVCVRACVRIDPSSSKKNVTSQAAWQTFSFTLEAQRKAPNSYRVVGEDFLQEFRPEIPHAALISLGFISPKRLSP